MNRAFVVLVIVAILLLIGTVALTYEPVPPMVSAWGTQPREMPSCTVETLINVTAHR